jgi:serine O-acetyltransferase
MNEEFYHHIFNKQARIGAVPSNEVIAGWAMDVISLMYPERQNFRHQSPEHIHESFLKSEHALTEILFATNACAECDIKNISRVFFDDISRLYQTLNTDISAILEGDPAAKSQFEIIRTYPGFLAICFYRIAHALLLLDIPLIPRILTEYAHSQTGIDIHPGAVIGTYLYIDHGTGIVIGETSVIGDHVKLYQGVTLGALSVEKFMANMKRHPTIEDGVIIYSGATILGGNTVIGRNCIIGGNVWLTKSVPPESTVYHKSAIEVVETKNKI